MVFQKVAFLVIVDFLQSRANQTFLGEVPVILLTLDISLLQTPANRCGNGVKY